MAYTTKIPRSMTNAYNAHEFYIRYVTGLTLKVKDTKQYCVQIKEKDFKL
jgi:hypothetical protein